MKFLFVLLSLTFINNFAFAQKSLNIAFGEGRPPFVYQENGKWKGFEIDIVKEALESKGYKVGKVSHVVNKMLEEALKRNFDVSVSVQDINDGAYYSDNFVTYINYAISREEDKIQIDKISDLTKHFPIAWQNAYKNLGEEYAKYYGPDKKDKLSNYKEFGNQEEQNKFFWSKRANVIIIDKTIFSWYQKQLAPNQKVIFHNIFPAETHYQVKFLDKKIRDDFNEALHAMRKNGRYEAIVNSYIK